MQITFGMHLDGCDWSPAQATLGVITVGPLGMLKLLEDRLGFSGIEAGQPERINQFMQKIARANCSWCNASFELDRWSTAKQLLAWRDELIESGWNGVAGGSERLETLWKIEQTGSPVSPGHADRVQQILEALNGVSFHDELTHVEPVDCLPPVWRSIVQKLQACGMKLIPNKPQTASTPEIYVVNGKDEFSNAVQLARYLSSGDNRNLALICEGDSRVLDGILHRFGFGAVGAASASRWRESLQILPLWLETLWKPFHPQRFLELLLLPYSIIPKVIGRNLVKALQEEPGIGGEGWRKAWEEAENAIRENKFNYYKDIELEIEKLTSLRQMLEKDSFNAETGVLEETLIRRCDLLLERLAPQVATHPELALTMSHAKTLKEIIPYKGLIDRIQLARMLDSIISTGTASEVQRECNDFQVTTSPGMLQQDCDTVLWWNCIDSGKEKTTYWTPAELAVLSGVDSVALRKCEVLSWRNALNHAKKRLIVFVPSLIAGEAVFPHPFLDELAISQLNMLGDLDNGTNWHLADRQTMLKEVVSRECKETEIGPNEIRPLRRLSFSQLSTFLSCPFQWFMQDYLGLSMPPAMNVKTGSLLIGSLAHKVVEMLFKEGKTWNEDEAAARAGVFFDALTPQMAAELLLDGRSVEKERIRETLCSSIEFLISEINTRNLMVIGTEQAQRGTFCKHEFVGYLDIQLQDAAGKPFVIDMKWSTSSHYEKHLREGKALQLAAYSWMLKPGDFDVQCAYFLFPKQAFVTDSRQDWKALWQKAEATWEERMATLHSGVLECGIGDENELQKSPNPLPLPLTAGCNFCNYSALCAIKKEVAE